MGLKTISFKGEELVVAGRVRRAWGVKGEVSVDWNNGACPVKVGKDLIYIGSDDEGSLKEYIIIRDHRHGDCNIVRCDGMTSRDEADKIRGLYIWVPVSKLERLPDGEYYSYQLLDMRVESTEGEYLGEIKEIFSTGSNDVYVVKKEGEEILVPAIEDVVQTIDLDKKLMVIELIEGLR